MWQTLDRPDQGAVTRLTHGTYAVPPDGGDGRTWRPTLEAAGLAGATARFGNRNAILIGLGAARHWAAIPRAIGVTAVAVPEARWPPVELDQGGRVHQIPRDIDRLQAVLETTELGPALVTTPAQTLYDLTMKPAQGRVPEEADAAAQSPRSGSGRRSSDCRGHTWSCERGVADHAENNDSGGASCRRAVMAGPSRLP